MVLPLFVPVQWDIFYLQTHAFLVRQALTPTLLKPLYALVVRLGLIQMQHKPHNALVVGLGITRTQLKPRYVWYVRRVPMPARLRLLSASIALQAHTTI